MPSGPRPRRIRSTESEEVAHQAHQQGHGLRRQGASPSRQEQERARLRRGAVQAAEDPLLFPEDDPASLKHQGHPHIIQGQGRWFCPGPRPGKDLPRGTDQHPPGAGEPVPMPLPTERLSRGQNLPAAKDHLAAAKDRRHRARIHHPGRHAWRTRLTRDSSLLSR